MAKRRRRHRAGRRCRRRASGRRSGGGCSRGTTATAATCPGATATDPYHILVSEIMLQQTQVDRVLPKYHEWLQHVSRRSRRWPRARSTRPSQAWYPLGYNIRPRRLHSIARESVARYGGTLPSDEATLLSFKGIGPYTAGAIRSFAFGQRAAILDTNVARVLFRVFVGGGDPKSHAMRRHLWDGVARAAAAQAGLRLQPGADGLRRDGLHGAEAEVPARARCGAAARPRWQRRGTRSVGRTRVMLPPGLRRSGRVPCTSSASAGGTASEAALRACPGGVPAGSRRPAAHP